MKDGNNLIIAQFDDITPVLDVYLIKLLNSEIKICELNKGYVEII